MVRRLVLISMSIKNVIGALRCELGVDPATVRFVRPEDGDAFADLWRPGPGMSFDFDMHLFVAPEDELSKNELLAILEGRGDAQRSAPMLGAD